MNNDKLLHKKTFLFFFLIIILTSNVSALGLSPSRISMDFTPLGEVSQQVCVAGSGTRYINLTISGNQKDHIKLIKADNIIDNQILDTMKSPCFSYDFIIPETISTPGLNRNQIMVEEMPGDFGDGIGIKVIIYHQIDVHVPYPGKYLLINAFGAKNSKAGEIVPIGASIENKGYNTISSAYGDVKIYNKNGDLLKELKTNTQNNIATNEQREIRTSWDSQEYKEGNYYATIDIKYDGLNMSSKSDFKLGGLDVNLIKYTEIIQKGGLKPFIATVDSIWSEQISNVHIIAQVYNNTENKELLTTFETVTRTLAPWGTSDLGAYVDTDKMDYGNHTLKMTLYYDNTSKEYDKILSIIPVPVVEPIKEQSKIFTTKNILVAIIVILLIILVSVLFTIFFPKQKKDEEKKQ